MWRVAEGSHTPISLTLLAEQSIDRGEEDHMGCSQNQGPLLVTYSIMAPNILGSKWDLNVGNYPYVFVPAEVSGPRARN